MLQMRPNCECCDVDLPPESGEARICSFECTFCAACADQRLAGHRPRNQPATANSRKLASSAARMLAP